MKTSQVNCDACGKDITATTNCIDWRIELSCQKLATLGGVVTSMCAEPELKRNHHFCGLNCLLKWVEIKGWQIKK